MVETSKTPEKKGGGKGSGKKYPPTVNLAVGESLVALALEVGETTWNDKPRTVVTTVIRGKPDNETFTIWWPQNLPLPALLRPFYLKRNAQWEYECLRGSTDEEDRTLWKDGNFGAAGPVLVTPDRIKGALDKLK